MSDPWLTIVGLGEDGPEGLSAASLTALQEAEVIMGATRHLALLPDTSANLITWPVPFADGIPMLMSQRGKPVVVLASGDPFWHGAGAVIVKDLTPGEWRCLPAIGTMSLAAAKLGWPLERTACLGLHAAPFSKLRLHLHTDARVLATVRDGPAVADLGQWLCSAGFGQTTLHILEALGGPREQVRSVTADKVPTDIQHPVSVGIEIKGDGRTVPLANGRPDALFLNDGQITKRPVRALTLSALAPTPGAYLWDIGGGSGSIAIEWLWSHPTMAATAIEIDPERADRIRENAAKLGVSLDVVTGAAPEILERLPLPDVVFIGGGISQTMLSWIWQNLPEGTRLVANGVTLEAEMLLAAWHSDKGGDLLRIEMSESKPLGSKRGWKASYPIVQWSVTL